MTQVLKIYGSDYKPALDEKRLVTQQEHIKRLMLASGWLTLSEIEYRTGFGQASISAQLRHCRRQGLILEKKRRGEEKQGLFEYRLRTPENQVEMF